MLGVTRTAVSKPNTGSTKAQATNGRSTRRARVTVTVPSDVLQAAAERVQRGPSSSLSAFVSDALAEKLAAELDRDNFVAWLRQLDNELGPPSAEAYTWAKEALGL